MEQYDDRFHIRKHPRMRNYDYSQPGFYFITICTKEKKSIFGEPGCPNRYGQLAHQGLRNIEEHFRDVRVDKCVVMPNHIHAIVVLSGSTTTLSAVIGQYKSAVNKKDSHDKTRYRSLASILS
ncbi:MAG: hypothetical protein ACI4PO_07605 [Faecousia sp.]